MSDAPKNPPSGPSPVRAWHAELAWLPGLGVRADVLIEAAGDRFAAVTSGVSAGDLPATVKPADLARYVATIVYGMAVQAAGGASRDKLQHVVEMALRTLPL